MEIYTSRIGKPGTDITVKGSQYPKFAPTWDMVWGIKQGGITEAEYTKMYLNRLSLVTPEDIESLLSTAKDNKIVLLCYCKAGAFCHRVLLAKWLEEKEYGVYKGEL
jgi:uncharacterized protein YeaO (DUF488 family)